MRTGRAVPIAVALAAVLSAAATAAGATQHRQSSTRTFSLSAGQTRTFDLIYPHALQFGNARYQCNARILLGIIGQGQAPPSLGKVHVLERGSALGGSECRVRVRNDNAAGTGPVRVRVTATTRWTA